MGRVLVIDDDSTVNRFLSRLLNHMGHEVTLAMTSKEGLRASQSGVFDVVLLDVRLPDGNGLDMIPHIRTSPSSPEVIIITGEGDADGAEVAIRRGAWDYIQKSCSPSSFSRRLDRVLKYHERRASLSSPKALDLDGIVGDSPEMRMCLDLVAQAAGSRANVLINGETGTGKELVAWAIHNNSSRAGKNFAVVDCATLPEPLVESTLFGHEKGAFTGAVQAQDGLIKHADGGTLFLDEVGELSLRLQKAFLRVLQEHRFRPIGGNREEESEFRLISATNKDLEQLVKEGNFREDLLFRLRCFEIELPPLRKRRGDIRDLVVHHVSKICQQQDLETKGILPELFQALEAQAYDWPGNVRELVNALERAIAVARSHSILFPEHLPQHIRICLARSSVGKRPSSEGALMPNLNPDATSLPALREFRAIAEKHYLQELMVRTGGKLDEAKAMARLSLPRLYALLRKHGLKKSRPN
jgi:two-component system NtrC family response regulator